TFCTAFSNSVRGNNCNSWLKMLHTLVTGGSPPMVHVSSMQTLAEFYRPLFKMLIWRVMSPKTLAPILLFVLMTLDFGARAQQSETSASPAPSPAWNDNSLVAAQREGGDPTRSGDVKIEFYGTMHSRSHRRPV
ncbi:MAG: hypothetical protein QOI43_3171, partial [Gaiellales bacterium]|nr:hypothetical protein [Gaiellales bacterium]